MNVSANPKNVLLYDPYLDVLGGGEQHMLYVLQALEDMGYDVTIAWPDATITQAIEHKFGLRFKTLQFNEMLFSPETNALTRARLLSQFHVVLYITDGSYFASTAANNILYAMVPHQALYPHTLIDRAKFLNWRIVANSRFTQAALAQWGYRSTVHYPCISPSSLKLFLPEKKQKLILSVGRFFKQLHSKKQKELIETFIQLTQTQKAFANYRLVLAGGLKTEDRDYFGELEAIANNNPQIQLLPNCSFTKLQELYTTATYFWHFTGMGVDPHAHPEQVEHLGITPLEAMAAGCITCCVNAGGPLEIITNKKDGYLFSTPEELIGYMSESQDPTTQKNMSVAAHERIQQTFSYEAFKKRVLSELHLA